MADDDAERMFDRFLSQYAPDLVIAAEADSHRAFLAELFVACSPLRGLLPGPVVQQQASLRETAYRADYPAAMRRVVLAEGAPIGRIMVDWAIDGAAMLIDIAVTPERQREGAGSAMLRSYLAVADRRGQCAMLQVMRDNPAQQLYAQLGFAPVESRDFAPHLDMVREPRA
jgi:ribosomal protein S18 acetylase RimI-like enzyme